MDFVSSSVTTKDGLCDRFILIVKPEQSGKTFLMIKKIFNTVIYLNDLSYLFPF